MYRPTTNHWLNPLNTQQITPHWGFRMIYDHQRWKWENSKFKWNRARSCVTSTHRYRQLNEESLLIFECFGICFSFLWGSKMFYRNGIALCCASNGTHPLHRHECSWSPNWKYELKAIAFYFDCSWNSVAFLCAAIESIVNITYLQCVALNICGSHFDWSLLHRMRMKQEERKTELNIIIFWNKVTWLCSPASLS